MWIARKAIQNLLIPKKEEYYGPIKVNQTWWEPKNNSFDMVVLPNTWKNTYPNILLFGGHHLSQNIFRTCINVCYFYMLIYYTVVVVPCHHKLYIMKKIYISRFFQCLARSSAVRLCVISIYTYTLQLYVWYIYVFTWAFCWWAIFPKYLRVFCCDFRSAGERYGRLLECERAKCIWKLFFIIFIHNLRRHISS